jgi:hypothetical protein
LTLGELKREAQTEFRRGVYGTEYRDSRMTYHVRVALSGATFVLSLRNERFLYGRGAGSSELPIRY